VNIIGKKHFTFLYSAARSGAFTLRNIKAGFATTRPLPFNLDRMLNTMPKPLPRLSTVEADGGALSSAR